MSIYERACFASNYLLWKKCIELNESIIILDDDVNFNDEFAKHIERIIELDFEMLRISYHAHNEKKISCLLEKDIGLVLKNNLLGSYFYRINPKGAKKLLDKAKIWFCPVDYYLDMFYFHKIWNLLYRVELVGFMENGGTLIHYKIPFKIYMARKIFRPLSKFFSHIYKFIYLCFNNPKKEFKNLKNKCEYE